MSTDVQLASPGAGWYEDGFTPDKIRWWDGSAWTSHVRDLDHADPKSPAPAPYAPEPVVIDEPADDPRQPAYVPLPGLPAADPVAEAASRRTLREEQGRTSTAQSPIFTQPPRSYVPMVVPTWNATAYVPRFTASTQTFAIWLFALFPIWAGGAMAAVNILRPIEDILLGYSVLFVLLLILCFSLAVSDRRQLRARGFDPVASPAWTLLMPLVYLIVRAVRVGRGGIAPLLTFVLVPLVASVAVLVPLALGAFTQVGQPLAVQPGVPLTLEERTAALSPDAMATEVTIQFLQRENMEVSALVCEPFPSTESGATTKCVGTIEGFASVVALRATPEDPLAAFAIDSYAQQR